MKGEVKGGSVVWGMVTRRDVDGMRRFREGDERVYPVRCLGNIMGVLAYMAELNCNLGDCKERTLIVPTRLG
jgi:hypothetical protein